MSAFYSEFAWSVNGGLCAEPLVPVERRQEQDEVSEAQWPSQRGHALGAVTGQVGKRLFVLTSSWDREAGERGNYLRFAGLAPHVSHDLDESDSRGFGGVFSKQRRGQRLVVGEESRWKSGAWTVEVGACAGVAAAKSRFGRPIDAQATQLHSPICSPSSNAR